MRKITSYFKGVAYEARRVRWPHRKLLWTTVGAVCLITLVSALVIVFEDWMTVRVMKGFEDALSNSASASASAAAMVGSFIGGFIK